MASPRLRNALSWTLASLLAAGYLLAALGKLTGAATGSFEGWGYPAWFATLIGAIELVGAIGLLIPKAHQWAIYGLSVIMMGAAFTHLINGEGLQVLRPIVFLGVLWASWWLRRGRPAAQ